MLGNTLSNKQSRHKARTHGFRKRMADQAKGSNVLKNRRLKGRKRLTV